MPKIIPWVTLEKAPPPTIRFTPSQRRALLWLPSDGSATTAPRDISSALGSLMIYHPDLAECGLAVKGPQRYGYWLTKAGIEEQKRQKDAAP